MFSDFPYSLNPKIIIFFTLTLENYVDKLFSSGVVPNVEGDKNCCAWIIFPEVYPFPLSRITEIPEVYHATDFKIPLFFPIFEVLSNYS